MESPSTPMISSGHPAVRKKRSDFRRRPHLTPKPVIIDRLYSSRTDCSGNENRKSYRLNIKLSNPELGISSPGYVEHGENHIDEQRESLHVPDPVGDENKPRKVKLKLRGISRTLQTKSLSEITSGSGPASVEFLDNFDSNADMQEQNHSKNGLSCVKGSSSRVTYHDGDVWNATSKSVYKGNPPPKKRAMDDEDDDEDAEINYLKKLRASKAVSGNKYIQDESNSRSKGSHAIGKKGKMRDNYDYEVEPMVNIADPVTRSNREMTMTTRKRALECPETASSMGFPKSLPAPSSKKQKLSEVEQQLRKAEVAQRRKLQAEKAAKEAEAEAIRKILGQDANRKKKEEKLKKQQEQLAQEKTSKAATLGPNTVRWIIGPHGTTVTFSDDIGLPKIFGSQPYRYPPPREKCVGPNCKNEYKYRDSKSKLPICSLHCYKAVQQNAELLPAC